MIVRASQQESAGTFAGNEAVGIRRGEQAVPLHIRRKSRRTEVGIDADQNHVRVPALEQKFLRAQQCQRAADTAIGNDGGVGMEFGSKFVLDIKEQGPTKAAKTTGPILLCNAQDERKRRVCPRRSRQRLKAFANSRRRHFGELREPAPWGFHRHFTANNPTPRTRHKASFVEIVDTAPYRSTASRRGKSDASHHAGSKDRKCRTHSILSGSESGSTAAASDG
jgi:hypothetical protein